LHALPPWDGAPASRLAALVGLSTFRFLHLFREHTGTSYRRYRLWLRMLRAAEALSSGHDLTGAAAGAGFASSSHFSDSLPPHVRRAPASPVGDGDPPVRIALT
jgi:AraC-like DNA-binding protein